MTNELSGWIGTLTSAVDQMQHWPVAVLIVVALIVFGGMLKALSLFPNKFIPVCVLGAGSSLNVLLGEFAGPDQRHPEIVLGLQGLILGFIAWALHAFLLKRFERFIPILEGKGDGETTTKTETKDE